jgi:hypothetical protein
VAALAERITAVAGGAPLDAPTIVAALYELADTAPVAAERQAQGAIVEAVAVRADAARDDSKRRGDVPVAVDVPD